MGSILGSLPVAVVYQATVAGDLMYHPSNKPKPNADHAKTWFVIEYLCFSLVIGASLENAQKYLVGGDKREIVCQRNDDDVIRDEVYNHGFVLLT